MPPATQRDSEYGVTQPGDHDYPLKTKDGSAGTIFEIQKRYGGKTLYEDPDFPATPSSIGDIKGDFIWLRPHEICERANVGPPKFAVRQSEDDALISYNDLRQWGVGDCWLIAAMATVAANPKQLEIVVPPDNETGFDEGSYCGAFHFRIFHMVSGKFADIVVDDRLPCTKGNSRPAFLQVLNDGPEYATKHNEFWPGLIEKAFAKYFGNYFGLSGGSASKGLMYLTGGFADFIYLSTYRTSKLYTELQNQIKRYIDDKQFLCVSTDGRDEAEKKADPDGFKNLGLVDHHGYSIVGGADVKEKSDPSKTHFLVRLRNPWGHYEWKGPFSDTDDAGWAKMEKDLRPRNAAGSANLDEGTFWMDCHDIIRLFFFVDYCIDQLEDGIKLCTIQSEWPAELQEAKLDPADPKFFHLFPAFSFEARRELMNVEIPPEQDGNCVVSLRITVGEVGVPLDPLAKFWYHIHEIQDGDDISNAAALEKFYATRKRVTAGYNYFMNLSEVMNRVGIYLKPGRYLITLALKANDVPPIIPKAYVGKPIPFAINLFTENETKLEKVN